MDNVDCSSVSSYHNLRYCTHITSHNCGSSEGAGAICTGFLFPIALFGGSDYSEGNLFALNDNSYMGPVCDDGWHDIDASVACRQLGYTGGTTTYYSNYGSVPSVFAFDDVVCEGTETSIQSCDYQRTDNCGSHEGAGARCLGDNSVVVVGGNGYSYGNIFARNSAGFYGPVCDDGWDNNDATVVCRQLGYTYGTARTNSYYGSVPSLFSMDDVQCTGSESSIQDCRYILRDNCSGSEGAGISCSNTAREIEEGTGEEESLTNEEKGEDAFENNVVVMANLNDDDNSAKDKDKKADE